MLRMEWMAGITETWAGKKHGRKMGAKNIRRYFFRKKWTIIIKEKRGRAVGALFWNENPGVQIFLRPREKCL